MGIRPVAVDKHFLVDFQIPLIIYKIIIAFADLVPAFTIGFFSLLHISLQLFFGNVYKKFQQHIIIISQLLFKSIDMPVARIYSFNLIRIAVKGIFIFQIVPAAVIHSHIAFCRQLPPERLKKRLVRFFIRHFGSRINSEPAGIHLLHHMIDDDATL